MSLWEWPIAEVKRSIWGLGRHVTSEKDTIPLPWDTVKVWFTFILPPLPLGFCWVNHVAACILSDSHFGMSEYVQNILLNAHSIRIFDLFLQEDLDCTKNQVFGQCKWRTLDVVQKDSLNAQILSFEIDLELVQPFCVLGKNKTEDKKYQVTGERSLTLRPKHKLEELVIWDNTVAEFMTLSAPIQLVIHAQTHKDTSFVWRQDIQV